MSANTSTPSAPYNVQGRDKPLPEAPPTVGTSRARPKALEVIGGAQVSRNRFQGRLQPFLHLLRVYSSALRCRGHVLRRTRPSRLDYATRSTPTATKPASIAHLHTCLASSAGSRRRFALCLSLPPPTSRANLSRRGLEAFAKRAAALRPKAARPLNQLVSP